jgi:serine/threonine protein kinase
LKTAPYIFRPPFQAKWDAVRLLGRGGYGDVHEVITDTGIRCAAKTIRLPEWQRDDKQGCRVVQKLIDAERNLCKLIHRNIVSFLWISHQDASAVLFMELLDGVTLESAIGRKALDEDRIVCFASQVRATHFITLACDPHVLSIIFTICIICNKSVACSLSTSKTWFYIRRSAAR